MNHTAATQLSGLKEQIGGIHLLYNATLGPSRGQVDQKNFILKVCGVCTDHAADQKLFVKLLEGWKWEVDREERGRQYLQDLPPETLSVLMCASLQQCLNNVGGADAWNSLPAAKRKLQNEAHLKELYTHFGDQEFAKLSEEEQRAIDEMLWKGCCMHKELNSFKAGYVKMSKYWLDHDLLGPHKLMNRDNSAAFNLGNSAEKERVSEASQAGGVKLTDLAGKLFRDKDDKKGQQDTYLNFFEKHLGFRTKFPDTSNTRFQSHGDAACELIVHLDLYIEFMETIRDNEGTRTFNHMEANVYEGLKDIPTQEELAIMAVVSQSVTRPYMRHVRNADSLGVNGLDLAPLHWNVLDFMHQIAEDPNIILVETATPESATFDKTPWDRPEVFYTVQSACSKYLTYFITGTAVAFERFSAEFEKGGVLDRLTPSMHLQAFLMANNDINEGALGRFRVISRRCPSLTEAHYNALIC